MVEYLVKQFIFTLVNNQLDIMCKEMVLPYFEVLSRQRLSQHLVFVNVR
jgi:hypothetical protein